MNLHPALAECTQMNQANSTIAERIGYFVILK